YKKAYAGLSAEVWDFFGKLAAKVSPANPAATMSAVSLIPEVRDLANNEFAVIMKTPAAIVHGDETQAAALRRDLDAAVCEFVSDRTSIAGALPAFIRPYWEHRSCRGGQ